MSGPEYLTREAVGLVPPPGPLRRLPTPVGTLFVHHTATAGRVPAREWQAVQRFHVETRRYSDIAYHAGVVDGAVFEGRPPRMMGGATLDWNDESLAVAAIGDYSTREPSDGLLRTIAWVGRLWMALGLLVEDPVLLGHRDEGTTTCPGDRLYACLPTVRRYLTDPPKEDPVYAIRNAATGQIHVAGAAGVGSPLPAWSDFLALEAAGVLDPPPRPDVGDNDSGNTAGRRWVSLPAGAVGSLPSAAFPARPPDE